MHRREVAADKVNIEMFYEAECNACREAITTSFKKAMKAEGFLDMASLSLYPYGNAKETKAMFSNFYRYKCQHGMDECHWNMIEACGQHFITDVMTQFNFLECIEQEEYGQADMKE